MSSIFIHSKLKLTYIVESNLFPSFHFRDIFPLENTTFFQFPNRHLARHHNTKHCLNLSSLSVSSSDLLPASVMRCFQILSSHTIYRVFFILRFFQLSRCLFKGGYTCDFHRALATRQNLKKSHHRREQKIARVAAALGDVFIQICLIHERKISAFIANVCRPLYWWMNLITNTVSLHKNMLLSVERNASTNNSDN